MDSKTVVNYVIDYSIGVNGVKVNGVKVNDVFMYLYIIIIVIKCIV